MRLKRESFFIEAGCLYCDCFYFTYRLLEFLWIIVFVSSLSVTTFSPTLWPFDRLISRGEKMSACIWISVSFNGSGVVTLLCFPQSLSFSLLYSLLSKMLRKVSGWLNKYIFLCRKEASSATVLSEDAWRRFDVHDPLTGCNKCDAIR